MAIEQGPNDRRATDYPLPGALRYFDFLKSELIPTIENDYRILATERTLSGTSYGGVFVGVALLIDDTENPLFKNYLSFDPSFYVHQSQTSQLESARFNASNNMRATVMFSSALLRGNDQYVTWFKGLLDARNYRGLNIIRTSYRVDHNDVAGPSFDDALNMLF